MRRMRHPLTGATYEWADDGIGPVQVTDNEGLQGRFDRDGNCVQGPMYAADPELCRWIVSGGSDPGGAAARSRRFSAAEAEPSTAHARPAVNLEEIT